MSRFTGILVVAVALTCLLAGATPVLAAPGDGEIQQSVFREELDDVVTVPLQIPAGATATLAVSNDAYERKVTVRDSNADGAVTVHLNTFAERTGRHAGYTAVEPDRVTNRGDRTGRMTVGNHMIELSVDGRYQDTSLLRIVEGQARGARTVSAPKDTDFTRGNTLRALPTVDSVAAGDRAIAAFDVDGLAGPIALGDLPGDNLIYAQPGDPGETARHTAQVDASARDVTFNSVEISYANEGGVGPGRLTGVNLERVSVDADGDGRPERDLSRSVTGTFVRESGTLSVDFDSYHELESQETLYLEYSGLTNPRRAGTYPVAVSFGGYVQTGEVAYGPAGDGVFGNGVDVTVSTEEDTLVDPLPFEYVLDGDEDHLYVSVPTTEPTTMAVNLTKPNPLEDGPVTLSTTMAVVPRSVSFKDHDLESDELTISGSTTIAPGSSIQLYILADERFASTLYDVRAVVDERKQFRTSINASDLQNGTVVTVSQQTFGLDTDTAYQFTIPDEDS